MAHDSRLRIIEILKRRNMASVGELSQALGLTPVTIRHHLDSLLADHIVSEPVPRRRPGPGRPEDAGVTLDVIRRFGVEIPILGVCLGHQAIGLAFGGRVVRAARPVHGKTSTIEHDGRGVFSGITAPFQASRYHSLIVAEEGMPPVLEVAARTREDGTIMGLRHKERPIHGVQFHPESILTAEGRRILRNFLN